MAMLSEPRRKQKLSLDPRNNNWKNDESRFGLKLMEKMGWSKGKGLGANEQGATENIKVKVKNNTVGLGATKNHEDNWIAHQDEFNQLLSKLNDCHRQNDSTATGDKALFSLEEKSKSSKKRVHYQKYTKGKDLSSRSATDLACVFGKRIKQIKVSNDDEKEIEVLTRPLQELGLSDKTMEVIVASWRDNTQKQYMTRVKKWEEFCTQSNISYDADTANLPIRENPKALEPNVEINTVTSPLTIQEYFASRIAQRTNRKAVQEIQQATAAQELVGNEMQSSEVIIKSKKKRNKIIEESCDFIEPSIFRKRVKNEGDKNNVLAEDNQIKENYQCKKSRTKAK